MILNNREVSKSSTDWIPRLTRFLIEESGVEAIEVNTDEESLKVATLGTVDLEALEERLNATLEEVKALSAEEEEAVLVQASGGQFYLQKPTCLTAPTLWRWRNLKWVEPEEAGATVPKREDTEEWRTLMWFAGFCGIFGLTGWILDGFLPVADWVPKVFYVLAMLSGGWDAAKDVRENLPKGKLDIHFLMLSVAVGASAIGAWTEGALLLFLFSLSGALEHFALHRTRREIESLFESAPRQARVVGPEGEEEQVRVESVKPGAVIRVLPGDVFPLDAEVESGETAADESTLTGEAAPVGKGAGDTVYSGTINLWGAVECRVLRPVQRSALQKIIRLIREAQQQRAPSQSFTDRFGTKYTLLILGLTVGMFFIWWMGFGVPAFRNEGDRFSAFYRAMTLLVVASPCALVLSIPSAILAAIAWGARNGILFRGGAAIEELAEVDRVALDKTGTLTTGEMEVERVESFPEGNEPMLTRLAVSLEAQSNHPIARAIQRYGKKEGIEALPVENFRSLTGKGIQGRSGGSHCVLGRREILEMGPFKRWIEEVPQPSPEYTEVWILHEGLIGRLLLRDEIREASESALKAIRARGLQTVMLTGDRRSTAERVARDLGIDEVEAGLSPEGKVRLIQGWEAAGERTAMVGDGINDAPSLAAAHVAVAMGARGSDAALEQSDVVLMHDRIENFMEAFVLSRDARLIIRQNIVLALGTVVVMVVSSLFGVVPLTVGVFAHEGSTVLVCLNSLRLLFRKGVAGSAPGTAD